MQTSKRVLSPQQKRDQYAEIAAAMDVLTPSQSLQLLGRIHAGEDVAADIQSARNSRKRWEFLQRVSRWVFGAEDKDLDRWAGIVN